MNYSKSFLKNYKFLLEILAFSLVIFLLFHYFFKLDTNYIYRNNYFPWDSFEYLKFINNFQAGEVIYKINSPFNERILFPFLVYKISNIFNIKYIDAALYLNTFSIVISFLIYFWLSFHFRISILARWIIFLTFLISWEGPFRTSLYYPGSSFGFDCLLISILTFLTYFYYKNKSKIFYYFLPLFFFLFTFQRGIVILSIPFFFIIFNIILKKFIKNKYIILKDINFYCFLTSFASLIMIKFNSLGSGSYSMFRNIVKFIYFRIHPLEFFYTFYLALGGIFLIIIVYLLLFLKNDFKKKIIFYLKNNNTYLITIFFTSIVLSTIGGDDSNRFLLWFFIWYLLIGSYCLDFFFNINKKFSTFFFIILSLLWSRCFIPAMPPLSFSDRFVANQYVSTNYDIRLFYGFDYFKKFRNDIVKIKIPIGEPYLLRKNNDTEEIYVTSNFSSPEYYFLQYWNAYKYRINNIPFPLGYLHNQRDALVDHPTHGKSWVRLIYIAQWILLTIVFFYKFRSKIIK
jgi:hypothetical protein